MNYLRSCRLFVTATVILISALACSDNRGGADQLLPLVSWSDTRHAASERNVPVVILLEQRNCAFCQRLKRDLFRPLANDPNYRDRAIFLSVLTDIDAAPVERDGTEISGFEFAQQFSSSTTPTVLFLDANANELQPRIVGYDATPDYDQTLFQRVEHSIAAVASN